MKTLNAILGYLPYVLAAVMGVEQSVASQPGAIKKQLVLTAITAATQVGEQVPEFHVKAISSLIDGIVAALNSSGLFAHHSTTATTPAA